MTTADDGRRWDRRQVLGAGAALLGGLAGCSSVFGTASSGTPTDGGLSGDDGTADGLFGLGPGTTARTPADGAVTVAGRTDSRGGTGPGAGWGPVHVQVSHELAPLVGDVATQWNLNPLPSEGGLWQGAADELGTDERFADYFARRRGLEPTGERSRPPFPVQVSVAPGGAAPEGLTGGPVDVGEVDREGPAGPAAASAPPGGEDSPFVDHAIARTGSVFYASPALGEAGVEALTVAELEAVYTGDVENWAALGGPDRPVYLVSGVEGPESRTVRERLFGRAAFDLDARSGPPARRAATVRKRDDGLCDAPVGFVEGSLHVVDIVVDGTRYAPFDAGYPTTWKVPLSTDGRADARERALIDAVRSPVGRLHVRHLRDLVPLE